KGDSEAKQPRYLRGVGADKIAGLGNGITYPYSLDVGSTNTVVGLDLPADRREATCAVVLEPGKTVKGRIVDPSGKPITGVRSTGPTRREIGAQRTDRFTLTGIDPGRAQPYFFQHDEKKLGTVVLIKADRADERTI